MSEGPRDQLLTAVAQNDQLTVVEMVTGGLIDINEPLNSANDSALVVAALHGHTDLCRFLMSNGADLGTRNIHGNGPAWACIRSGSLEALRYFFEEVEVPINERYQFNDTALIVAAWVGWPAGVRYLIEQGADLTAEGQNGLIAYQWAVRASNDTCRDALREAMEAQNIPIPEVDVDQNNDNNNDNDNDNNNSNNEENVENEDNSPDKNSPEYLARYLTGQQSLGLLKAIEDDDVSSFMHVARAIRRQGQNLNKLLWDNLYTAFYRACSKGRLAMARFLVEDCGVEPAEPLDRNNGNTPLLFTTPHLPVMRLLLEEYRMNPYLGNISGNNLLMACALGENLDTSSYLIDNWGMSVNTRGQYNDTPTIFCAYQGNVKMTRYLAHQCCSDLTLQGQDDQVAMYWAERRGHTAITPLLRYESAFGADLFMGWCKTGRLSAVRSALRVAEYVMKNPSAQNGEKKSDDPEKKEGSEGTTNGTDVGGEVSPEPEVPSSETAEEEAEEDKTDPILSALKYSEETKVNELLVQSGGQRFLTLPEYLWTRDYNGRTALFHAVLYGHIHVVDYLLNVTDRVPASLLVPEEPPEVEELKFESKKESGDKSSDKPEENDESGDKNKSGDNNKSGDKVKSSDKNKSEDNDKSGDKSGDKSSNKAPTLTAAVAQQTLLFQRDFWGFSLLHAAVLQDRVKMLAYLLDGYDFSQFLRGQHPLALRCRDGRSLLETAIVYQSYRCVEYLLDYRPFSLSEQKTLSRGPDLTPEDYVKRLQTTSADGSNMLSRAAQLAERNVICFFVRKALGFNPFASATDGAMGSGKDESATQEGKQGTDNAESKSTPKLQRMPSESKNAPNSDVTPHTPVMRRTSGDDPVVLIGRARAVIRLIKATSEGRDAIQWAGRRRQWRIAALLSSLVTRLSGCVQEWRSQLSISGEEKEGNSSNKDREIMAALLLDQRRALFSSAVRSLRREMIKPSTVEKKFASRQSARVPDEEREQIEKESAQFMESPQLVRTQSLKEEPKVYAEESRCSICWRDSGKSEEDCQIVTLYPCGHKCICIDCCNKVTSCPICRQAIKADSI